ncbi:cytochrome P450 [Xylariaceae sp. FL0255]|nr:cytochrome P450 [Xylariaceae sp. FL0255]
MAELVMNLLRVSDNVVWTAVVLLPFFYCLVLTSSLLLHPLRDFPGPVVAALSDWYGAFYAVKRNLHLITLRDHQRYGPMVRQGPNKLVFNTATAFRDIYYNEAVTKSHSYLVGDASLKDKTIFCAIDPDVHRTKRKLIGQVISDRAMRNFEPIMLQQIEIFLQELRRSCHDSRDPEPVNMHRLCQYLGMDIVGLLSFGYEFHLQTNEKNRFLLKSIEYMSWHANVLIQMPVLSWLFTEVWLNLFLFRIQIKSYRLLQTIIKERLALEKEARFDLYSSLAGSDKLEVNDIWSEATFFLQAGHGDTTATCLSAAFFYLSRNSTSYGTLAKEIRSAFADASDIRAGPTLASCHYLRACIDETLRLSPPAPGTLWREQNMNDAKDHLLIDGHVIPKGTAIGINIYALHHNEKYFPDPFIFKPERWLDSKGTPIHHDGFAAFLAGPRGCAGKAMAYLEISLVLAKTIWHFDFQPTDGPHGRIGAAGHGHGRNRVNEYQLYDIFTATCDGPYLTFNSCFDKFKNLGDDE